MGMGVEPKDVFQHPAGWEELLRSELGFLLLETIVAVLIAGTLILRCSFTAKTVSIGL